MRGQSWKAVFAAAAVVFFGFFLLGPTDSTVPTSYATVPSEIVATPDVGEVFIAEDCPGGVCPIPESTVATVQTVSSPQYVYTSAPVSYGPTRPTSVSYSMPASSSVSYGSTGSTMASYPATTRYMVSNSQSVSYGCTGSTYAARTPVRNFVRNRPVRSFLGRLFGRR